MQYVFVALILLVATGLLWTWWSSRTDRDPVSTVHSFNRALHAMQPGEHAADADAARQPSDPAEVR